MGRKGLTSIQKEKRWRKACHILWFGKWHLCNFFHCKNLFIAILLSTQSLIHEAFMILYQSYRCPFCWTQEVKWKFATKKVSIVNIIIISWTVHCLKKCGFPIRISSVNLTKSRDFCGFRHIYWRNPPYWKTLFFFFAVVRRRRSRVFVNPFYKFTELLHTQSLNNEKIGNLLFPVSLFKLSNNILWHSWHIWRSIRDHNSLRILEVTYRTYCPIFSFPSVKYYDGRPCHRPIFI